MLGDRREPSQRWPPYWTAPYTFANWLSWYVEMNMYVSKAQPHCNYLEIYISQNIRLCNGDFEGQFQTNLQAKSITFLVWKFKFIINIFLLFFAEFVKIHCFLHTVAAIPKSWHIAVFASSVPVLANGITMLALVLQILNTDSKDFKGQNIIF